MVVEPLTRRCTVTMPPTTLATPVFDDVQVASDVTGREVPSANRAVAIKVVVDSDGREGLLLKETPTAPGDPSAETDTERTLGPDGVEDPQPTAATSTRNRIAIL